MTNVVKLLLFLVFITQNTTIGFLVYSYKETEALKLENEQLWEVNFQTKKNLAALTLALLDNIEHETQARKNIQTETAYLQDRLELLNRLLENVHECAQAIPYIEKARKLCGSGIMEYYCEVVETFENTCYNTSNGNFSLPQTSNTSLSERILELAEDYQ